MNLPTGSLHLPPRYALHRLAPRWRTGYGKGTRTQLIRPYGLYSSRIKGRWEEMDYVTARAPERWRDEHDLRPTNNEKPMGFAPLSDSEEVGPTARKSAWARLLARVYEVDPLICPKRSSSMKVIAVYQDVVEMRRILLYIMKVGRAPPGRDESSLS